ncbi:MAG: CoA-binding protein [Bacteroidota bacterium]
MDSNLKNTLVLGATTKPERYANIATLRLLENGHKVFAFGQKAGKIEDLEIETEWNPTWDVDTVTLYLNPTNQIPYYQKIIDLKPKRVIFNPGTENAEFSEMLNENGIESEIACTLVLLSLGTY